MAKLIILRNTNQTWRNYRGSLINENKWRATKNGIDSNLLDLGQNKEVPYRELMFEMLEFINDIVDDLGTKDHIISIEDIINNGSSADRQLAIYNKSNDMKLVVDHLIKETAQELNN